MKKWSILAVVLAALTLCAVLALLFFQTLSPGERYEKAEKLLELGELEAAAKSFTALGEYKDSAERAAEIREIFVNGNTAWKYYQKYAEPAVGRPAVCLPSTSPANAAWSLE